MVDLLSKTTEGIESAVDGGICRENNSKMREPRAFYKDGGVFRENSKVCNVAYELLRSTTTNPLKPYASLDDVFYGAFKLGTFVSLEESKLDTNFAMLTSRYLVVF